MTRVGRDFGDTMQKDAVPAVSADVVFASSRFPNYRIGANNQIVEGKDDRKVLSMKEVVARETAQLLEQQNRLSVRDLASKFEKGLAAAAKLSEEARLREAASLEKHVLLKKLRDALESLKGRVAGRNKDDVVDAISMEEFFEDCWDILKNDIMKIMEEFFEKGIVNAVTNETFICLIPKKSDSLKVTDYRPISLVTGLYKIIAKTLASRLKEVLDTTVSLNQGAFVKDRQILDAVLIANEVVEEMRQKKEKGLVLKIDFEKAYDHVEWRFLEEVLQRKGFGNRWRKWMQGCLSSANFSILINGRPRGKFQASRGLRQGDPLSPFLFILVVDVLSRLMEKAQETDLIKGLCIGQEKVEISHLQFADDTIFFLTEDEEVWNNLIQVLNLFCSVSGLKINKAKCFLAGINSENEKLNRLAASWGCEVGCWPIKYLGLPLGGRPRAIKFWDPVVETMERRLQSWKKAFLSRGGKLTLIQSVLGSLPIYYMSLYKIPCGVRGRIERLMKGFLWEGMEEGKKTHLAKWELVTKNKEEGGLGVGNLRNQNEALLAKWLWRFPRESQSLWHKVIKSKYGLQANGWEALPQRRVSSRSPWNDISSGSQQFHRCCTFEVGNGERVRFWEDGWLSGGPLKEQFPRLFLLSRKHNQNISSFVEVSASPLSWNFDFRRNLNEMEIVEVATLLLKLEEVRLSPIKRDIRRWNLEVSGLFSCKSYRSLRSNDGSVHYFPPYHQIWKSKVPPKVKILVWLVAIGNLNTCDRIQRRNPLMCLSPHWCSLCKAKEESVNHIFLHCSYSIQLWWKLFQEVKVEALAVQLTQREGELIQEKAEVKKLANFLKKASEDAKKLVDEERAFARAEIENARAAVQRVEKALQEQEQMSRASGKQDLEELMKEVQEARRIKMLHQPSKVMDMEHELRALRAQLTEKSKNSVRLQKELAMSKRGLEKISELFELDGPEVLGSYLRIQPCSGDAPELCKCLIQWYRVSSQGGKKESISGAIKSVYAPEPFDVGRVLQVDIIYEGQRLTLTTAGPIDPAAGLGSYVEALVRKHDIEFNVVITQMNGVNHPSESIHVFHVGKMRIKLCKGKTTIAKEYFSPSMQLCGVRGGGNAAAQALFWQAKQGLSYVLAFESERERNAAIMLARRFAFDCNIMLAGPDDRTPLGT